MQAPEAPEVMSRSGAGAPPGVGWGALLDTLESDAGKDSRMQGWSSRKIQTGSWDGRRKGKGKRGRVKLVSEDIPRLCLLHLCKLGFGWWGSEAALVGRNTWVKTCRHPS